MRLGPACILSVAGEGMQGPAGVRTDHPPLGDENNGMGDLEPGILKRPEGIKGPEGIAHLGLHVKLCNLTYSRCGDGHHVLLYLCCNS